MTPRSVRPKRWKNGEATASGWAAEQTSCRKPGSVSSSVLHPPPMAWRALDEVHRDSGGGQGDGGGEPVGPAADDDRVGT